MGCYDTVVYKDTHFQTKSLGCNMDCYYIIDNMLYTKETSADCYVANFETGDGITVYPDSFMRIIMSFRRGVLISAMYIIHNKLALPSTVVIEDDTTFMREEAPHYSDYVVVSEDDWKDVFNHRVEHGWELDKTE